MLKRSLAILLTLLIAFSAFGSLSASALNGTPYICEPEEDVPNDVEEPPMPKLSSDGMWGYYTNDDGTVSVAYYAGDSSDVTVPAYIDAKRVISIDSLNYMGFHMIWNSHNAASVRRLTVSEGIESVLSLKKTNIEEVFLPDSVTVIDQHAFDECKKLTQVHFGSGITSYCTGMFDECPQLTQVTLPASVSAVNVEKKVYTSLLYDEDPLKNIYVDPDNPYLCSVDGVLYSKDLKELVFFPSSHASAYVVPDGVEKIGERAFYRSEGLTGITLPESLVSIGEQAFFESNIRTIRFPASFTSLSCDLFDNCYSLVSIEVAEDNPLFCSVDGVLFNKDRTELVFFPNNKLTSGAKSAPTYYVPDGVERIGMKAFAGRFRYGTARIVLPDSVEVIGDYAFSNNASMESVSLGGGVKELGSFAFAGCSGMHGIELPTSLETIGYAAFYNSGLTEIEVPASVTKIYPSAFEASSLTKAVIKAPIATLGTETFSKCGDLEEVVLPETLTYIGPYAFFETDLSEIYIPDSVLDIDVCAFYNSDVAILGAAGSYAEKFASDYGYDFTVSNGGYENISILEAEAELEEVSYVYDGSRKEPAVTLTMDSKTLTPDKDYTVTYENNLSAGTAAAVISGSGRYTDTLRLEFRIIPMHSEALTWELGAYDAVYSGSEKKPSVTLYDGSRALKSGRDYLVTYADNILPGTAAAKITCIGNYGGSITIPFTVEPKDISKLSLTVSAEALTYNGSQQRPAVTLKDGTTVLENGADYTVAYADNIDAGEASVTVTCSGKYTGTATRKFTVSPRSIASAQVVPEQNSYMYDGNEKRPLVAVILDNKTLSADTDYTVSYSSNTAVGNASVTVTGRGNYSGTASASFRITEAITDISACDIKIGGVYSYTTTYDGSAQTPSLTVKKGSYTLVKGTDYTVAYKDNINAGEAKITLTGIGSYKGSLTKSFTITPRDPRRTVIDVEKYFYDYDGTEKRPALILECDGVKLTEGVDFITTYSNNIEPGEALIEWQLIGNYYGGSKTTFKISPLHLFYTTVSFEREHTYDGSAKKPSVTVTRGDVIFREGVDYTVSYSSNVNVGTGYVTITPITSDKSRLSGSASSKYFNIRARSITLASSKLSGDSFSYDGTEKKPGVTVTDLGKTLKNGTDYELSYKNNISAGKATVTVTGLGNYTGSFDCTYYISGTALRSSDVSVESGPFEYRSSPVKPAVTVKYGSKTLTLNTDYTVAYSNNNAPGSASVTVTGKGNYTGSVTKTFTIKRAQQLDMVWGKSNWSFTNNWQNFYKTTRGKRIDIINEEYLNVLKQKFSRDNYFYDERGVKQIFPASEYDLALSYANTQWGGCCYGMSALVMLSAAGLVPYSQYTSGAKSLYELDLPKNNSKVASLITYYHLSQNRLDIMYNYNCCEREPDKQTIQRFLKNIDDYGMCLICFDWTKPDGGNAGHAVVGYAYESCSYKADNVVYDRCIRICDPNCTTYNTNYNIYFKSSDYSWINPHYQNCSSNKGACMSGCIGDVNFINDKGYLTGTSYAKNTAAADNFTARLNTYEAAADAELSKAYESNGEYYAIVSDNIDDMVHKTRILSYDGEDSPSSDGYDLLDANNSYILRQQAAPVDLELNNYGYRYLAAGSSVSEVVFDDDSKLSIKGDDTDYSLTMTVNSELPTDWFTLTASGDSADRVTLAMTGDGYVLTGDDLHNVTVSAHNAESEAVTTFSTDSASVLIYELNENTIGLRADADGDGEFDTELTADELIPIDSFILTVDEPEAFNGEPLEPDVTVTDGETTLVRGVDYTVRYFNNAETGAALAVVYGKGEYTGALTGEFTVPYPEYALGDVDGDGSVTILDATCIQKNIADIPAPEYRENTADIDSDGDVTILDVTALQRHLAGLAPSASIGKPVK